MKKFFKQLFCKHVHNITQHLPTGKVREFDCGGVTTFDSFIIREECLKCGKKNIRKELKLS